MKGSQIMAYQQLLLGLKHISYSGPQPDNMQIYIIVYTCTHIH